MARIIDHRWASGLTVALLLAIFAYFIHDPMPQLGISFICLAISSWLIANKLKKEMIFGYIRSRTSFLLSSLAILLISFFISAYLRKSSGLSLLPTHFNSFAIVAVIIGCTEELVFRGWMQSVIPGRISGIVIPAFAHALYKSSLFLSPAALYEVDTLGLFSVTFIAGVLLSLSRRISGSTWPALFAHGLFDAIAYGDAVTPWWVM